MRRDEVMYLYQTMKISHGKMMKVKMAKVNFVTVRTAFTIRNQLQAMAQ